MSDTKNPKLITGTKACELLDSRVDAVVKRLNSLGIKTTNEPLRGPQGGFDGMFGIILNLSFDRKSLNIIPAGHAYWHSSSDGATVDPLTVPQISVTGYSSKHRQAVITLSEPARSFTRVVTIPFKGWLPTNDQFRSHFGMTLPGNTKYVVTNARRSRKKPSTATVTANVPASSTSFLVGFDERHMFVSMLKKSVNTVAEAHAELLPEELKGCKDVPRQGEFFFVPATKKEILSITEVDHNYHLLNANGDDTDHVASLAGLCSYSPYTYVSGEITNSRHARLFFDRWMRVVPNNEVPNRGQNWD